MKKVKILGSGCANCKRLEQIVRKVTFEHNIEAEIEKVTAYAEILRWPILSTPGLVVDGEVVSSGRIPSEAEVLAFLSE